MNTTHFNSVNRYTSIYSVRPGDTLSKIILKFYQVRYGSNEYKAALQQITSDNPQVNDPDKIKIGQSLILRKLNTPTGVESRPISANAQTISEADQKQFDSTVKALSIPEREAFWALSWLDDNWGPASAGIGASFASMGFLLGSESKGNISELKKLDGLYQDYKAGRLTKGQYDYRRRKLLETVAKNLGPTEKLFFNGQKARESMRISRKGGVPATSAIKKNTDKLAKLSKAVAKGGTVLTAVNLGLACDQIARAKTDVERSSIIVETAASTAVGTLAGAAIALVVLATPVGWVSALVLGTVSSFGSYTIGKMAARTYKEHYSGINIAANTGIGDVCSY
ncbi:LysM peptidoglycan-binding domain-containing protein [Vibrio harveyi]|uniref:LysM peptidoglycan-binding domain-containing protein n=2 Tax=Vibrio harveyi TaxID=669 RepID=UPI000681B114|nr:LysM domain-containing protein [Vibrio harveyi]